MLAFCDARARSIMKRSFLFRGKYFVAAIAAATLLVVAWFMRAEPDPKAYFPDDVFDNNKAAWFSAVFAAMQEPPLFASKDEDGTSYRFLKYLLLSYPVSVRIDADASGTAVLTYAVGSFASEGGVPGGLTDRKQRPLSAAEYSKFVTKFAELNICDLPASEPDERMILDGEVWMFEYRSGDEYCVIERLVPGSDPYVSTAQYILGLAGYFRSD